MSLSINMERDGVIWQARQYITTNPDTKPLDKRSGRFLWYATSMAFARATRDGLCVSEEQVHRRMLEQRSIDYPIGRQLTKQSELSNGRRMKLDLTLLNESVGNMPDYQREAADIKCIGRIGVLLHDMSEHTHFACGAPRFQTHLASGLDILSNNDVFLSSSCLTVCNYCHNVDIDEESKVLDQLGLETLYLDRDQHDESYDDGLRTYILRKQRLSALQTIGLQSFLREHLSS